MKDLFGIRVIVSVNVNVTLVSILTMKTASAEKIKIARIALFEHENECVCSYTICVVLAVIFSIISIGNGAYFAYFCWYSNKDVTDFKFGTFTQTTI